MFFPNSTGDGRKRKKYAGRGSQLLVKCRAAHFESLSIAKTVMSTGPMMFMALAFEQNDALPIYLDSELDEELFCTKKCSDKIEVQ